MYVIQIDVRFGLVLFKSEQFSYCLEIYFFPSCDRWFHLSQVSFRRQLEPERECQSFSLVYAHGERSLDLVILVTITSQLTSQFEWCFPIQFRW